MIAAIAGACLALFLTVAALVRLRGRWPVPGTIGRVLRWTGIAATVGIAVALLPVTSADSGSATAYLLGVPLVAAVAVAVADLTGRAVGFVTTVAALVVAVWGLVLGLGPGFSFVLPALVFGIAELTSVRPRGLTASST
ncbi:hypothetical protein FHX81_0958 [Saccharothrix saharensis]|uniref:Uncharacterized protein n=1 Tax=Saccharothrix saharensis TaxID=571190 RepID=A0A543J7A6_9PSEU|nr:hypothetical protein [Saccharothrix saharensis]TQM78682.1 hypothetical protein FHX81_0958 [Saccharothrix saharensis]